MKAWAMWVAIAMGFISGQAMADGNDLMRDCQALLRYDDTGKVAEPIRMGSCIGFMNGAIDIASALNKYVPTTDQICLPNGSATPVQLARVVVNFMKRQPQLMSFEEGGITITAFRIAFPCKAS